MSNLLKLEPGRIVINDAAIKNTNTPIILTLNSPRTIDVFNTSEFRTATYVITAKSDETRLSGGGNQPAMQTFNLTVFGDKTEVNHTIYGQVLLGNSDPFINVTCTINNKIVSVKLETIIGTKAYVTISKSYIGAF
jgi:hypothetical protein